MKVHFLQTIKRHFYDIFPCWYSWSLMMRSVSLSPHRYQHVEIIAGPHPLQHHPLCCRAEAKVNPQLSKIHSYFFLIKRSKLCFNMNTPDDRSCSSSRPPRPRPPWRRCLCATPPTTPSPPPPARAGGREPSTWTLGTSRMSSSTKWLQLKGSVDNVGSLIFYSFIS